jgi:hypothetical protein
MVRREAGEEALEVTEPVRCTSPAGESPVPVGAGRPGSRPQARGETPVSRAGRRKPLRREQPRGPQHEVKPAASTDSQSGSRAAHVTAKATPVAQEPERATGPGGVWGAARAEGEVRNTRGPSSRPSSRRAGPYKPSAKSGGAERESEGVVVPLIPVRQNTGGGKDPCGGHAVGGATCKGMPGLDPRQLPLRALTRGQRTRPPEAAGERGQAAMRTSPSVGLTTERSRGGVYELVRTMPALDRSLVSRVRENRTHGLKGGLAETRR